MKYEDHDVGCGETTQPGQGVHLSHSFLDHYLFRVLREGICILFNEIKLSISLNTELPKIIKYVIMGITDPVFLVRSRSVLFYCNEGQNGQKWDKTSSSSHGRIFKILVSNMGFLVSRNSMD